MKMARKTIQVDAFYHEKKRRSLQMQFYSGPQPSVCAVGSSSFFFFFPYRVLFYFSFYIYFHVAFLDINGSSGHLI